MIIADKEVLIYPASSPTAPLVILNAFENEGEEVHTELQKLKISDFTLAAVKITDWNTDMSLWAIPSVYKNDEPFTGGADAYLEKLTDKIIPTVIDEIGGKPIYIALVGYSLAGLFAIYAMYKTNMFQRIASASGSMWYPGFLDYARSNKIAEVPSKLYLSLGDKEAKTRNQIISKVEENTKELYEHYSSLGIDTLFEMNEGNHFKDAAQRLAKAIIWTLDQQKKESNHYGN